MTIKALTGLQPQWYEPEREDIDGKTGEITPIDMPEGQELTGFYIRPLFGSEYMDIAADQGLPGIKKAFRAGLLGWRNFTDENGKELGFSLAEACQIIPARYQLSIGRKIINISSFDGEQVKNS